MQTQKQTDGKTSQYNLSEFDRRVVEVLRCLVPDQKMTLTDGENKKWESICEQHGDLAITYIRKNGETIVQIVYDYNSSTEQEFWREAQ